MSWRVRHVCADRAMREQIAARMRVAEPGMAARDTSIREQRAEAEATRLALRAEADKLMRSLGHEASGRASHLLAERIGAIEAELEPVHARIAQLDAQMQALQRAAEQVTQTIRILEVLRPPSECRPSDSPLWGSRPVSSLRSEAVVDEAWAAFNAAERQELVLILVEKVVVNEPAGKLDIVFHDLGFLEAVDRRLEAGGAHDE